MSALLSCKVSNLEFEDEMLPQVTALWIASAGKFNLYSGALRSIPVTCQSDCPATITRPGWVYNSSRRTFDGAYSEGRFSGYETCFVCE